MMSRGNTALELSGKNVLNSLVTWIIFEDPLQIQCKIITCTTPFPIPLTLQSMLVRTCRYKKDFDLPCAVKGYVWAFLWAVLKIAQYEVG